MSLGRDEGGAGTPRIGRPDLRANESLLHELAREPFLYMPNPGNAGDSAIACATYMAFERFGCRYEPIDEETAVDRTAGRTVVYGGGGNLVRLYGNARSFIERHHRTAQQLVLLPHTIDGHEDLLAALGGNVHLVCRDAASHEHARRHAPRARLTLAHDMAFMLDVGQLLREGRARYAPLVSAPDLARRNLARLRQVALHRLRGRGGAELRAWREDSERTDAPLPADNFDVSRVFLADDMTPRAAHEATYRMVRFLDRFSAVHTNRLHVCILSLLLDKSVHLYPNSYGKNRNVYLHSMQGVFPRLAWHG